MKLYESSDNQTGDRITVTNNITRLQIITRLNKITRHPVFAVAGGGRGGAVQGGVVRGRQDHLRDVHLQLPVPHSALRLR